MQIDWFLCQICDEPLVDVWKDYMDGHLLMEHHQRCPSGHYDYSYAYGNTEVKIGDEVFQIHYSATPDEWRQFSDETKAAEQRLKDGFAHVAER